MKRLLIYLKNYKKEAVLAPVFKLVEVIFELLVPLIVAQIIDKGIPNENGAGLGTGYIITRCLILIAFGAVGLASAVTAQYFAAKAATGFAKELRADLFKKIQALSYYEIDGVGTSGLINRMTSDVNQIQTGVNMILRLFLRSPIVVFGAMIMAFTISASAGIVFAVTIVVLLVIIFGIMFISIPLYKKVQSALDNVTAATRETLTGSKVIRAFCKEEEEISIYNEKNSKLFSAQKFANKISALTNPITYVLINIAIIVLMNVGAIEVSAGSLKQGEVVALYNYMSQILIELIKLANLIMTVTKAFACAGRVEEIVDMQPTLKHTELTKKKEGAPFISFKNVSVKYSDGGDNALSNISFDVERGQTVGIIGGTASGKTTLVNLIPHFYDATEGSVEIDGINVNAYNDDILRTMCGIVPQKAVLFKGSIRENIRWGKNAGDEEIYKALETAQALDVVKSKKGGLDELVEQGGKNFSGGQRQRLTIARALVKKPDVLILDDSASALDYATDASLRAALKNLDYDPVVFIVSQRTSSLSHADKIIVLEDGEAVGIGTHAELLKTCPTYSEIHYSQYEKEGE